MINNFLFYFKVQKKKCTGGPHDEWTNCGSACPLTCEKPKRGLCTKVFSIK